MYGVVPNVKDRHYAKDVMQEGFLKHLSKLMLTKMKLLWCLLKK
jgi:hypothetical protein